MLEKSDADKCNFQTSSVTWPFFLQLLLIVSFPGRTCKVTLRMNCPLDARGFLWLRTQVVLPAAKSLPCPDYARVLFSN